MEKRISRIINYVFCFVFGFIILGSLFFKNAEFEPKHQIFVIFASIIWFLLFMFLFKKTSKLEMIKKKEPLFLVVSFIIFFIIQLVVAKNLEVIPSWDFGNNFNAAKDYVMSGSLNLADVYPNNYFLVFGMSLVYLISSWFGFMDFNTLSIIINIVFIDLSIFLVYLIIKKLLGFKQAILAILLCFLCSPFLLYTPIFYSDTLTMFIPVLMLYLFINIGKENSKKKNIILLICMGIILFIGYKLKASILTFFVAILMCWIFKSDNFKTKILNIGVVMITLLGLMVSYNLAEKTFLPNLNKISYPFTHWIMMGLNSENDIYGAYLDSDVINTSKSHDRFNYNVSVIKERITERKIIGNIQFYAKKTLDAWSDGTYFAPEKLSRKPVNDTFLHQIVLPNGKYNDYLFYITTGFIIAMYMIMFLGCAFDLKNKVNRFDSKTLLRCGLLGIWLFLLIWENRSRYLVNFVPIMIVLTTLSINTIQIVFEGFKKNSPKKPKKVIKTSRKDYPDKDVLN